MTARTAANVALGDQVAAVLRDSGPMPMGTIEVTRKATGREYCPDVYRQLRRLERLGLVEKIRLDGHTQVYWRWSG